MKNYYLKTGNRETGPFMLDDLKYQRISPDTQVKIDSGSWAPLSKNPDLRFLLDMNGIDAKADQVVSNKTAIGSVHVAQEQVVKAKSRIIFAVAVAIALMAAGMAVSIFMAAR